MTNQVISGAWYLENRRELDLLFPGGQRYRYANVPGEVARDFADAESKGIFFNRKIRNRFPCRPLDDTLDEVA